MAPFWQMEFGESPTVSGEGFVVRITALPQEDHCRYEVKRGSVWELELDDELPLASSGAIQRPHADAVCEALSRATVDAVPPDAIGILDGINYHLSINMGGNGVTYRWKCDLPHGWRALQPAIDLLTGLAHKQA